MSGETLSIDNSGFKAEKPNDSTIIGNAISSLKRYLSNKPKKESLITNTEEKTPEVTPEKRYYPPDLSRISENHTAEEMAKLSNKWEEWLNSDSGLSKHLSNTLETIYDNEEANWGYSELNSFFDNCKDIRSNIEKRGSKDGKTIADKINSTLDNNKELFGINSKTYVAATEDTILSITNGKYKGARLSYDDFPQAKIILGNQYGEITKDDKKRYGTTIENFYLENDG